MYVLWSTNKHYNVQMSVPHLLASWPQLSPNTPIFDCVTLLIYIEIALCAVNVPPVTWECIYYKNTNIFVEDIYEIFKSKG